LVPVNVKELLEATHLFPGPYTIKAIGTTGEDFVDRIVAAARSGLVRAEDVQFSVRTTPHGRHVAVSLELQVRTAQEVLDVYAALQVVQGLKFLM
jgi:putative lipoic acid-binding regulatory protein